MRSHDLGALIRYIALLTFSMAATGVNSGGVSLDVEAALLRSIIISVYMLINVVFADQIIKHP